MSNTGKNSELLATNPKKRQHDYPPRRQTSVAAGGRPGKLLSPERRRACVQAVREQLRTDSIASTIRDPNSNSSN
jgi:hypothetical protein